MYVERVQCRRAKKTYQQILLRESYRQPGQPRSRVKHRTLLNLTHCPPEDVAAIEMGLKYKHDLAALRKISGDKIHLRQGRSVGAVWLLWRLAERIGLVSALGCSQPARRALWQILARLIDQGSRLSAVRLAREHAACEILGLTDFSEDDLYGAMGWLDARQAKIEQHLFRKLPDHEASRLFLYDVTSSYLEGEHNAYGAYGYNRDGKRGKKQIVVGLLTNAQGLPVSVEVFAGNTPDPRTVASQIRKMAGRFGVREVTLVGDRGMIKSLPIERLHAESFHYLTAITKPQIESLLRQGVLQLEMFDESLCEVRVDGVRYIVRRNPARAEEILASREDKFRSVGRRVAEKNQYLREHRRARIDVALRKVTAHIEKLRVGEWVRIDARGRQILIERDGAALERLARLDGCYVLVSDVDAEAADAQTLHARYKDLAQVEQAFRTMKTGHLEIRPVYVRTPEHTRAHVFVVMLAYRLRLELAAAWRALDIEVEEGLGQLSTLCAQEVTFGKEGGYLTVPEPRPMLAELFAACAVDPPTTLPRSRSTVATKRKLPSRRKKI